MLCPTTKVIKFRAVSYLFLNLRYFLTLLRQADFSKHEYLTCTDRFYEFGFPINFFFHIEDQANNDECLDKFGFDTGYRFISNQNNFFLFILKKVTTCILVVYG